MAKGIGILPAIKVYLRYPAIASQNMAGNYVYAPLDYESPCQFSCRRGNEIQRHGMLTLINEVLVFLRHIVGWCLPKNNDAIVTVSGDGTNVLFGLQLNAWTMNIISIVSWFVGYIIYLLLFYFAGAKPMKQGRLVFEMKTLKVESLDIYRNEDSSEEEFVIDSTYL